MKKFLLGLVSSVALLGLAVPAHAGHCGVGFGYSSTYAVAAVSTPVVAAVAYPTVAVSVAAPTVAYPKVTAPAATEPVVAEPVAVSVAVPAVSVYTAPVVAAPVYAAPVLATVPTYSHGFGFAVGYAGSGFHRSVSVNRTLQTGRREVTRVRVRSRVR